VVGWDGGVVTDDGGGSKPCLERRRKKEEDDEREVAAENSIIPLHFSGNYEIVLVVVFVSENVCSVIIFQFGNDPRDIWTIMNYTLYPIVFAHSQVK